MGDDGVKTAGSAIAAPAVFSSCATAEGGREREGEGARGAGGAVCSFLSIPFCVSSSFNVSLCFVWSFVIFS